MLLLTPCVQSRETLSRGQKTHTLIPVLGKIMIINVCHFKLLYIACHEDQTGNQVQGDFIDYSAVTAPDTALLKNSAAALPLTCTQVFTWPSLKL